MNRRKRKTGLRILLVSLLTTPLLVWSLAGSATHNTSPPAASPFRDDSATDSKAVKLPFSPLALIAPPPQKADLDQVRNGTAAEPIDPASWVNGNAGASNSHYIEGQSIPYRLRLTNLSIGSHIVEIEWDIKHSGKNAIDYITSVVRTPPQALNEEIDPCLDVTPCTNTLSPTPLTGLNGYTAFPIPTPAASQMVGSDPEPQTSFGVLPAADKQFRIYNGVITNLTYINNSSGNLGDLAASQSSTRLQIAFNASDPTVVLSWGGHIASRNDWGFTDGVPNSAEGVSGSPYHTRLISLDGSGGNQDRSLSAAAVDPPAECGIACESGVNCTTVCQGDVHTYSSATQDPANTYSWSLSSNTSNAFIVGATNGTTVDVNAGNQAGSYTLNLSVLSAGGTTMCSIVVTVRATTAVDTGPSAAIACEGSTGPVSFSVIATGSNLSYVWKVDGNTVGDNSANLSYNPSSLADGVYPVTVDITGDCGTAFAQTTLTIQQATAILTPPSAQTACEGSAGPVDFSVTAEGVDLHYAWKVNGVGVGSDSSSLSYDSSGLANGEYTVRVDVTGTCGNAFAETTLTINNATEITTPVEDAEACDDSHGPVNFSVVAAGTGTLTYAWTVNGAPAGGNSPNLEYDPFALDPGTYTVRVDVTGDCGSAFDEATLTINSLPSATIAITEECDAFAKLTATPAGGSGSGYTFSWTGPSEGIAVDDGTCGPTRDCILVNKTGNYVVTVTDSNTCSGAQQGQLCLTLSSQGPPSMASIEVNINPPVTPPSQPTPPRASFMARLARVALWFL